jgi:hypothetical protein
MPFLVDVLEELHVAVIATVEDWGETLLLIAKPKFKSFPPPPEQCYTLAASTKDNGNPYITERTAEAIRRHFKPPDKSGLSTLGL